jgi:ribonuclease HII
MTPNPDLELEERLWPHFARVAGLDEAGRGALAGPVCAAAVILPPGRPDLAAALDGVRDSKQMTPRQRARLAPRILAAALAWAVAFAPAEEVDALGIAAAARLAAGRALAALPLDPDYLLSDYRLLVESPRPQTSLVRGDRKSLSIAAASVLAKTARDAHMRSLDEQYPGYGFARHKGYATPGHRLALARLGPCPEHRRSFSLGQAAE